MTTDAHSHIGTPFRIGDVTIPNRLVQAPMAGITGAAFRSQARRFGCALTVTEMISSYGVCYRNRRTLAMLDIAGEGRPLAVQLFGHEPEVMAEAAVAAAEAGADLIDINMGCPARKVVRTGAGVALMADEPRAAAIVSAVAAAVPVPVTAKFRAGPGRRVTALQFGRRLEEAGAAAVCIHPRTEAQGRKGAADHTLTARLAEALTIPVIASGDISDPESAAQLLTEAGAAAVMVGQAALGNPWLFADLLAGDEPRRRPLDEVLEEMERFWAGLAAEKGEERAIRNMRKFYGWYLAPFRPDNLLMSAVRRAPSFAEATAMTREALTDP